MEQEDTAQSAASQEEGERSGTQQGESTGGSRGESSAGDGNGNGNGHGGGSGGVEASTSTEDVSEMESNIDTFLEFTGSTDRQLALQYLLGSDGRLEPAVNLFLSGAPPQQESLLNFTAAARAVANNVDSLETWSELLETEGVGAVSEGCAFVTTEIS